MPADTNPDGDIFGGWLLGHMNLAAASVASSHSGGRTATIALESGLLPKGALQLIVGDVGDLLNHLTCQDVVSFTGSAATTAKLKNHPVVMRESVRFLAEQDSLNASTWGRMPDPALRNLICSSRKSRAR